MARISFSRSIGGIWPPDLFLATDVPFLAGASELRYLSAAGTTVVLTGTGFLYDDLGQPLRGSVAAVRVLASDGSELLRIDGARAALTTFLRLALGVDPGDGGPATGDGAAVLAHLLRGDDLVIGSAGADTLWGSLGAGPGNDSVRGGAGDDVIHGDAGADVLSGGAGIDRLDYQSSYRDGTAHQGIVLDAGAGTVMDCWGDLDSFQAFESYGDSAFDDVLTGSAGDEIWSLGAGRDVLAAGGGEDWLDYGEAAALGGRRGIIADLAAGWVRDPFGQTDTVSEVEGLGGTARDDVLRGDEENNAFDGRQGQDRFEGRAGFDRLGFWSVERLGGHGVEIDMAAAGAQVLDDGFGNAETILSIEAFTLSGLDDTFRGAAGLDDVAGGGGGDLILGDAGNDVLRGEGGADTIRGGAGRDWIEGGTGQDDLTGDSGADSFVFRHLGSDNADTIHGFASGVDRIWLANGWLGQPATGIAARHLLAGSGIEAATASYQRLLYDTASGVLRYDPDGSGVLAAEVIAVLAGQETLSWRDFAILS